MRAIFYGKLEAFSVAAGEQFGFTGGAALPDGPGGMNDMLREKVAAGSDNGFACLYAALAFANLGAFLFDCFAAGAPNCPVYAATADKCRVRGVDDGIYLRCSDVALDELNAGILCKVHGLFLFPEIETYLDKSVRIRPISEVPASSRGASE